MIGQEPFHLFMTIQAPFRRRQRDTFSNFPGLGDLIRLCKMSCRGRWYLPPTRLRWSTWGRRWGSLGGLEIPSGRESLKPADPTRVRRHDAFSHAQIEHLVLTHLPCSNLSAFSLLSGVLSRHFSELQSPTIGQTPKAHSCCEPLRITL